MPFQTRTETVPAVEVANEIDAENGLTDDAKQALLAGAAAGNVIEKNSFWRETGPVSFEKGAGFCLTFHANFRQLLDAGTTLQELKVVAYVLEKMEYGNLVSLSQTAMATDFGCSRQAISKHFKSLERRGFFVKSGGHLFVNSTIFAKGLTTRMDADRIANLKTAHDTRAGKFKPTLRAREPKPKTP